MRGRANTQEDFWDKVVFAEYGDCWHWQGGLDSTGYGTFSYAGRKCSCHRLAYQWLIGGIPVGLEVCHTCDTPTCVNPEHLFLETHQGNIKDRWCKGRCAKPRARISKEQVQQIRTDYASGTVSIGALAEQHSFSYAGMWLIVRRLTWKEVPQ